MIKLSQDLRKLGVFKESVPVRQVLIFIVTILTASYVSEFLHLLLMICNKYYCKETQNHSSAFSTYAIFDKSGTEDHLGHVITVLERLGYVRTTVEDDWDLLWAHDYPHISMRHKLKNLKKHQIVNHLPGCGFITNKVDLSTTSMPFIPKAFRLPSEKDDFLLFAKSHSNEMFVEKHNEHRQIRIRTPTEVNLFSNDSFVQVFIKNPFLLDGYKFDIGVYVVITSVEPLRIYVYAGDVLFRYCPVKYQPFDRYNADKYVVGDNYLPTWEIPSLKKYYTHLGGSMRGAFDAYMYDQGYDTNAIWTQVEEIILKTVLSKEQDMSRLLHSYKTKNFFELMRFDLIIDDNLKVHLMEANMSPNLSSAHFKPNALLYEQILYSVFNLMGIGSPLKSKKTEDRNAEWEMITAEKNLVTDLNKCLRFNCDNFCNLDHCALCLPCLTGTEYDILEKSHREHLHRINMKRIFPRPIFDLERFDIKAEIQNMTKRNSWITQWFYGKCRYDRSWCY